MPRHDRPASAAASETAGLSGVDFGHGDGPDVLSGVEVNLTRGSYNLVTGAHGSGKTSLLRLLALMETPRAGEVRLFGRPVRTTDRRAAALARRRIGASLGPGGLMAHLDLADNLALKPRLAGVGEAARRADVDEMLAWLGLADRRGLRPDRLSDGERRLLALAQAVMGGPELILADDPTAGLDARAAGRVAGLLRGLNRLGATVLIAGREPDAARLAEVEGPVALFALARGRLERRA